MRRITICSMRIILLYAVMPKIKAIRLSNQDNAQITEFLAQNPLFDFSSLARTSIISFIENPQLKIKAIKKTKKSKKRELYA